MKKLTILITTYHQAFIVRGGGEYELLSIADGLRQCGFIVDIYGPYSRPVDAYDVVLHFSVHGDGLELVRAIKASGKPLVLWPNVWATCLSPESVAAVREHVALADVVTFKSGAERNNFLKLADVPSDKIVECNAVADMCHLKPAPRDLFPQLYGVRNYALWIGLIEPRKNQKSIIGPLRERGIPLVMVGKYRDRSYYDECRREGGDDVMFIDSLPQRSEIVRSAFQCARFYVELSFEPAGLSSLDAGLSGCRLLLSDSEWSKEHFLEYAEYADPLSSTSISQGVDRVMQREQNSDALRQHVTKYCFPNAMVPLIEALNRAAR